MLKKINNMESYITLSFLNDFIFCPRSIYFHQLYGNFNEQHYKQKPQLEGKAAHESIDNKTYSTRTTVLQGIEVYSEKYNIAGKIDLLDIKKNKLSERKKEIKVIYDGYVFQTYAQYYGLTEMGYEVKEIVIYDITHNKSYPIELPENNPEMNKKFDQLISDIKTFDLSLTPFIANIEKCNRCIYSNLCDESLC